MGYKGRELRPGLTAMRIEPFAAMAEYLGLQLGLDASLVDVALRNKGLRQMLEGAPGWRELITLGKIWHLEQMEGADGGPLYDLIVVDAPATGPWCDLPRRAAGGALGRSGRARWAATPAWSRA